MHQNAYHQKKRNCCRRKPDQPVSTNLSRNEGQGIPKRFQVSFTLFVSLFHCRRISLNLQEFVCQCCLTQLVENSQFSTNRENEKANERERERKASTESRNHASLAMTASTTPRQRSKQSENASSSKARATLTIVPESTLLMPDDWPLSYAHSPPLSSPFVSRRTTGSHYRVAPRNLFERRRRRREFPSFYMMLVGRPRIVMMTMFFSLLVLGSVVIIIFQRISSKTKSHTYGEGSASALSDPNRSEFDRTSNSYGFQTHSWSAPACQPLPDPESISYTLVTQSSESRLWMMQYHCQKWNQNIAIAIASEVDDTNAYDTPYEEKQRHDKRNGYIKQFQSMGCNPSKLSVVVVPIKPSNNTSPPGKAKSTSNKPVTEYPINILRNRALSQVATSHAVYVDIDFWPSSDLYHVLNQSSIRRHLFQPRNGHNRDRTALIVPAFQIPRQCREYLDCRKQNILGMPRNWWDLIRKIKQRRAFQFDPTNQGGHGSTLYNSWMRQNSSQVLEIPCFQSNRYEPYLVFRYCRDVPPFQEAFTGYGKNKMTWVMQLRRMGWRFWQIGRSFLVHYPHLESPTRLLWNGGANGEQLRRPNNGTGDDDSGEFDFQAYARGQNDLKYLEFKKWMLATVPDRSVVPKCRRGSPTSNRSISSQTNHQEDDDSSKLWVPRRVIKRFKQDFEMEKKTAKAL